MSKTGTKAARAPASAPPHGVKDTPASPGAAALSDEDKSKDAFFVQIAELAEAMIAKHGKDFAIGTLVLSAKFIAEGKPLINRTDGRS